MLLVTGPNMAGKSTILRQIGLVVVLAQLGGFVPAASAHVGVVDRLFTRVGASDNLARGQSTFMVEMSETSAILHSATARSLVLLDEIGRGTSTYDGVAIAWAVSEHLHDLVGCKTMFATHYHELMQLPERLAHARNMNVAVRETGDRVVFLHRLEPGGTDRSYGVHVAQLAGLPDAVVRRAREVLVRLESEHRVVPGAPEPVARSGTTGALCGSSASPGTRGAAGHQPRHAHTAGGTQPARGTAAACSRGVSSSRPHALVLVLPRPAARPFRCRSCRYPTQRSSRSRSPAHR